MKKNKLHLLAVASISAWVVLAGMKPQPLSAGQPGTEPAKAQVDQESITDLLNSKIPVLVDFWAVWCGPCRVEGPIVERIGKAFDGRLKVARVEADKNPALSKAFNVQYLPTLVLIRNGKVVRRWEGVVSEKSLKTEIGRALDVKNPG